MDNWEEFGRWSIEECPEFIFSIEEQRRGPDQMLFVHLIVLKWAPSVLKELFRVFAAFREHEDRPLFAYSSDGSKKLTRLVMLFGFKFLTTIVCANGESRPLFINLKETPQCPARPLALEPVIPKNRALPLLGRFKPPI
jgi:hypothetical protein